MEDATINLSATRPVFNPLVPEYRDNPHPILHRLRSEDPVHWSGPTSAWVLTRYSDVMAAVRDPRLSASIKHWSNFTNFFMRDRQGGSSVLADTYLRFLLQLDPPDHTRLRGLINRTFTPRMLEQMRPRIVRIVHELLDGVQGRGEIDFMRDIARPLPIKVIAEMLGVPPQDSELILRWSARLPASFGPGMSRVAAGEVESALTAFGDYFRDLARQRRAQPKEDLISSLVAAQDQGDRLSEQELISTCILLSLAGHASTSQMIANAMVLLVRHPAAMQQLQREPALITSAVEEILRYESPTQLLYRTTLEPVEYGGKTIDKGQLIFLSLVAANRDPAQFPNPDHFDITRVDNRHLAFGYSIHYCLGAPLARIEGQVAIPAILDRMKNPRIDESRVQRQRDLLFRGIETLPVNFDNTSEAT